MVSPCFQFERELNFPVDWPASVSNILTVRSLKLLDGTLPVEYARCLLSHIGGRICRTLFTIRLNGAVACFLLLSLSRYADKRIVNIIKVYIERNNLQVELVRYSKNMLTLFTFNFAKRRIRSANAYQVDSNINHSSLCWFKSIVLFIIPSRLSINS